MFSLFDPFRDVCVSSQTWGGPGWQEHWRMDPTHVCILHRPRQHCKSPAGGRCECKCYHRQRINPPDACSKLWEWKHRILPATGTRQHCQTGPVLDMLCWWIEKSKQMSRRMKVSLLMWCTLLPEYDTIVVFLTPKARCWVGTEGLSRLDCPVPLHEHRPPAVGQVPAG